MFKRIKKILTLRISMDNVLGMAKYKKHTSISKENTNVLGTSKL